MLGVLLWLRVLVYEQTSAVAYNPDARLGRVTRDAARWTLALTSASHLIWQNGTALGSDSDDGFGRRHLRCAYARGLGRWHIAYDF